MDDARERFEQAQREVLAGKRPEDPTTHYMQATERMRIRAEQAESRLEALQEAVREWVEWTENVSYHERMATRPTCDGCLRPWPCPTERLRELSGQPEAQQETR